MEKVRVINVRFLNRIALGKEMYPTEYIGVGKDEADKQTATTIDGCVPELVFDHENNRLEVHIPASNLVQIVPFSALSLITVEKKEFDDAELSKKTVSRRAKAATQS